MVWLNSASWPTDLPSSGFSASFGGEPRSVWTREDSQNRYSAVGTGQVKMVWNHSCRVSWCRVCTYMGSVRCCSFLEGRVCNLSSKSAWSARFENTKPFNEIKTFLWKTTVRDIQRYPALAELLHLLLPSPLRRVQVKSSLYGGYCISSTLLPLRQHKQLDVTARPS